MSIPESREYKHQTCKTSTEISGPKFHALSDPLAGMKTTYCGQCDAIFSLNEFVWTDTGESIPDYYERHRRKASENELMLCSNTGLVTLGAIGLLIGFMIGTAICLTIGGWVGVFIAAFMALVGAVGGVIARETVVAPKIIQRVCGVNDTRQLE
jgi:hypothetical protein